MTALSIMATSVVAGAGAVIQNGLAGEAITAGQPLYLDTSTGKFLKADANAAGSAARVPLGIALNGASLNQPLAVQKKGDITIGATLTAGVAYYLGSAAAGTIVPVADLTTGDYPCIIGLAKTTTVLTLDIVSTGAVL